MPHIPASSALSRLRVLDLTRARAGPTCVKQLADFGADVIKIEAPAEAGDGITGDRDGSDFQNLHRNKRCMTLNLKHREGLPVFMRMVAGVPCGPIYTMDQVFDDAQVKHLKPAAPVAHPRLGGMRILAQSVGLSRTPASIVRATPEIGEHTDEVLAELGYADAEIKALHDQGAL